MVTVEVLPSAGEDVTLVEACCTLVSVALISFSVPGKD